MATMSLALIVYERPGKRVEIWSDDGRLVLRQWWCECGHAGRPIHYTADDGHIGWACAYCRCIVMAEIACAALRGDMA